MAYEPSYTDCISRRPERAEEPNVSCRNWLGQAIGACRMVEKEVDSLQ